MPSQCPDKHLKNRRCKAKRHGDDPWRFDCSPSVGLNRAACPHGRLPATLRYSLLACARSRSCSRSSSVRSGSACVRSSSRSRSSSVARSSSSARSGSSRIRSGSASVRSSSGRSRCSSRVASRGSSLVAALAACSKCHSRQQRCYEEGFLHDHVLLWLKVSNSANLPVMCSNTDPGRWWRRTS
jgi:hypothetical protein